MSLTFGTDGIRGRFGQYPFVPQALRALGSAIGLWARQKTPQPPTILVGYDTRISCDAILQDLLHGLAAHQNSVEVAGVIPTPAVLELMQQSNRYTAGIVISASHNPYHDNGIKLFTLPHGKLTDADEAAICTYFTQYKERQIAAPKQATRLSNASNGYLEALMADIPQDLCKGLKIVLDCAHGATFAVAPTLFKALGAEVITVGTMPDGTNINRACGALYPMKLSRVVRAHQANVGFAFDGDGDRVVAVNQHGIIKDGDDLLALLLGLPEYKHQSIIVGTVMSNKGLEDFAIQQGKHLVRTKVGDKYVAKALETHGALLGGEASGHVILRNYLASGDGLRTALKVVQALHYTSNWNMETFAKLPQALVNVRVQERKELSSEPLRHVVDQYQHTVEQFSGRMIVRYSGTEPLLRVMVEAPELVQAHTTAQAIAQALANLCSH